MYLSDLFDVSAIAPVLSRRLSRAAPLIDSPDHAVLSGPLGNSKDGY